MIIAKWRKGFEEYFKADAQKVAEEIMSIGEDANTHQILDYARNESSELHKCFEWDDSLAAEKYRNLQARKVVQMLVIKEEVIPTERPEIRFFHIAEKEKSYQPTQVIVRNKDKYKEMLEQAWRELRSFKAKYQMLTELQEIFDLID